MSLSVKTLAATGVALVISGTAAVADRPGPGCCDGGGPTTETPNDTGGSAVGGPQCQVIGGAVDLDGETFSVNPIRTILDFSQITFYSVNGQIISVPTRTFNLNGDPSQSCRTQICDHAEQYGADCLQPQQPAAIAQPRTPSYQPRPAEQRQITPTPAREIIATHVMADCANTDALRRDLISGTNVDTFVRRETHTLAERADLIGQQLTTEQIGEMAFCNTYAVIHEPNQTACSFNTNENGELVIGADAIRFAETGEGCEIATTPESVICEPNATIDPDLNDLERRLQALEAERNSFCAPTVEQGASLFNGVNNAQWHLAAASFAVVAAEFGIQIDESATNNADFPEPQPDRSTPSEQIVPTGFDNFQPVGPRR